MKYLKLTENQKQIIEFKNAQNSAVNVPIMFIGKAIVTGKQIGRAHV